VPNFLTFSGGSNYKLDRAPSGRSRDAAAVAAARVVVVVVVVVVMYLSHGGSLRFAVGFVAGVLLREASARKGRRPPRSLLAPSSREGWDDASSPRVLVRRLERDDEDKGFLSLLSQLTTVGNVTSEQFASRLLDVRNGPEFVYVVEDGGAIVAAGTLVLERKFARGCGLCGHIEDVVVDERARGKGLGLVIVRALTRVAESVGCYKVILDCSEDNQAFYERCGMRRKEVQMALYFSD